MIVCGSGGVTFANQRRSQRILFAVPLSVSGRSAYETAFIGQTSTLIVNASGRLVALKETALVAQTLSLKNENTDMEISCAVVNIERQANGLQEVGVEFSGGYRNFWRVNFPPPIGPRVVQTQSTSSTKPRPRRRELRPSSDSVSK